MNLTIQAKGLSALALATGLLAWISFLINRQLPSFSSEMVLWAGAQSMVAFWALLWAIPRSNRAFYSIFVGDALLRLVGLGAATAWLWSRHLPFTGPLLCLATAFLLLSFIQIPFFQKVH